MPITKRQKEILEYLKAFLLEEGYSPTLEEIANHFGLASLFEMLERFVAIAEASIGLTQRIMDDAGVGLQ